jgi:hypothetical protein
MIKANRSRPERIQAFKKPSIIKNWCSSQEKPSWIFTCPHVTAQPYVIQNPGSLRTPRLVVFHQRLLYNLQTMKGLMSQGASSLSLTSLCPHVKTHKSP